jgi:flavin-dependent thymidylate synthase
MAEILKMHDPWKHLRANLFGNTEPEVALEGITMPIDWQDGPPHETIHGSYSDNTYGPTVPWEQVEQLPALAAGTSYGSKEKLEGDSERAIKLNKNLIKMGHHTPLEAIQLNFHVSGISKACGAQVSRHRIGQGHVSASRRFQAAEPKFVYPVLDYIDNLDNAEGVLNSLSQANQDAYDCYQGLREGKWFRDCPVVHKEDARMILPVSYATERTWWINMRAFRDFLRLRLAPDAEWEVRRLAQMMFNLTYPLMPSLLEDIKEKFE